MDQESVIAELLDRIQTLEDKVFDLESQLSEIEASVGGDAPIKRKSNKKPQK